MTLYDVTRGTVSTADNTNLASISAYFANAFGSEDTKPTIGAMPKCCVAGGCSRGSEGGFSLHAFPKDPVRRTLWSEQVARYRADWTGPTEHSMICSLYFTKECYEISLAEDMGLPSKRRQLKETAVPTLFPKAADVKSGSMVWAYSSIHQQTLQAMGLASITKPRAVVTKRKRAQVYAQQCFWIVNHYD